MPLRFVSSPRVGSQLFINNEDTPAVVQRGVRQMHEAKLSLIRVFISWDHIEPTRSQWQWERYDALFAAAEECGMAVVPTLMSVSPPGWMGLTGGPQDVGPLEDPEFIRRSEEYLHRVVERWRDHPALDSWILWNEPDRVLPRTPATLRAYAEYLRHRYEGDLSRYEQHAYQRFASFEEVAARQRGEATIYSSHIDKLEWSRFAVANVTGHLRRIAAIVRQLDAVHPVHVNPHRVSQNRLFAGQSLWAEGEVVDFMGCSAHPPYHSVRFPRERWHQSIAMFADLMRSCTAQTDEHFWLSELQGGTTVFSGFTAMGPTPADLRAWMWEGIGAGARAIVFWCFNWRTSGFEAGEWSLLGQGGQISSRLKEVAAFADFLRAHDRFLRHARPPEPDVLILYSEASMLLGAVDGLGEDVASPRNGQMVADALCGAYLMAADLGREVQFIDERRLREQHWPRSARTLLVPGALALEPCTIAALGAFVQQGGTVIADHLIGWKTPDGTVALDARAMLARVFGAEADDIRAEPGEFELRTADAAVAGWFLQIELRPLPGTRVLARWANGTAAATALAHGAASAIRIGTVFFQRYLSSDRPEHLALLASLLPPSHAAVELVEPNSRRRLRRLRHDRELVVLVMNHEADDEVLLRVAPTGCLETADGTRCASDENGLVRTIVPTGTHRLFVFAPVAPLPEVEAAPTRTLVSSGA